MGASQTVKLNTVGDLNENKQVLSRILPNNKTKFMRFAMINIMVAKSCAQTIASAYKGRK